MERKKKKLIYNVVVSLLLIAGLVWVSSHFVHLGIVAVGYHSALLDKRGRVGIYRAEQQLKKLLLRRHGISYLAQLAR